MTEEAVGVTLVAAEPVQEAVDCSVNIPVALPLVTVPFNRQEAPGSIVGLQGGIPATLVKFATETPELVKLE